MEECGVSERESFSQQFRKCNSDGTCQHFNRARYDSMTPDSQAHYDETKASMCLPPEYCGPRGPLFCTLKPGVCSSGHCPLLKKGESFSA